MTAKSDEAIELRPRGEPQEQRVVDRHGGFRSTAIIVDRSSENVRHSNVRQFGEVLPVHR
jgi:hypothetical protein